MSFEIVSRREAQIDLDEIFIWYAEQKSGPGLHFMNEFESVINKIILNPYYASAIGIETDARSTSLKKFPYEIIFRIDEVNQLVRIVAVIHQRRNPGWFTKRLG